MVAESISRSVRHAPPRGIAAGQRLAGAGGLVFAAAVLVQNIIRGSGPSFTAAPAEVSAYFSAHRVAGLVPLGLFPLEMLALFSFAAGIWVRARDHADGRWWAGIGVLAVAAIAGLFAVVNIIEIVIAARGDELASSPQVVQALWAVHSAAFGLNLSAIAIALVGVSRAARSAALIPRLLAIVAVPGAACLFVAAVLTVAIVNGSAWLYLGYAGFAVWGVVLVVAGLSLVTGRTAPVPQLSRTLG